MTTCRSCNADVFFVRSVKADRLMILDAKPSEAGNVQIIDNKAHVLAGLLLEHGRAEGARLRTSHHATCPDRDAWRKKKVSGG